MFKPQNKKNIGFVLVLIFALVLHVYLGYFVHRNDFAWVFLTFSALFIVHGTSWFIGFSEKKLLGLGVLLRLSLLLMLPNLSQDFYRFLWDGRMLLAGWNPYIHLPNDLMGEADFRIGNQSDLYAGMGELSAGHYSNYPPINQLFFVLSGLVSPQSILGGAVVLRLCIILGDLAVFYGLRKILIRANRSKNWAFLYFLNPFVIVELTGNLHFEGVMLAFFVWSIVIFTQEKVKVAAWLYSFSILTKLLPILLLPLFLRSLWWKKMLIFYGMIGLICAGLFAPFLTGDFFSAYSETIGLWFVNFEFNASLYYIIREIGYGFTGYNIIQIVGKITPFVVIGIVLAFSFLRKNGTQNQLLNSCLWIFTLYFGLSTTVHPWYIANVLVLGIATGYLFPVLWSFLVLLSYSAYAAGGFQESMLLISVEYIVLFIGILTELILRDTKQYVSFRNRIFCE